jgi:hypothetical protein
MSNFKGWTSENYAEMQHEQLKRRLEKSEIRRRETPNGTPILVHWKDEPTELGMQSLNSGVLYPNVPKRIEKMVYCPTKTEYFHWVKNFKG